MRNQFFLEITVQYFNYVYLISYSKIAKPCRNILAIVMARGNRRRGVNLGPRDRGLATLIPVVLHGGASGVKLARRAAP